MGVKRYLSGVDPRISAAVIAGVISLIVTFGGGAVQRNAIMNEVTLGYCTLFVETLCKPDAPEYLNEWAFYHLEQRCADHPFPDYIRAALSAGYVNFSLRENTAERVQRIQISLDDEARHLADTIGWETELGSPVVYTITLPLEERRDLLRSALLKLDEKMPDR